jgi:hypothetical protein
MVGVQECGWLDVKSGVYQLDDPSGAEELVKDVAGFANSKAGGLLLVGFGTRKQGDSEVVDSVRPVPRNLVDLDRHRKLIRERVIPPPRDVDVRWIDCGSDKGILVIDVPAQPSARVPHVVPGPTRSADVSRLSVATPIREADATVWLPQAEIQRLLAAGWTATGGPSEEYLNGLIEQAVAAARRESPAAKPSIEIGEGEPGWRGSFHQAWNDLMSNHIWIGEPASLVYWDGPGVVQHFEASNSLHGWVLCALPHQRAVAVAGEVWQALQTAGAGVPGGDALSAVGFPAPDALSTRVFAADVGHVDLAGGQWGSGRLRRNADSGEWRWEPSIRFSMNMTAASGYWTARQVPRQLRLRAIATLPWADADGFDITSQRRSDLEPGLSGSALAELITTLSLHRGADLRAACWNRGPNRNALDALSYSSIITSPDGQVALSAEVMAALPTTTHSSVVTCAELRIESLEAWAETAAADSPVRQDQRLTTEDVAQILAVAWETATEMLPAAIADNTSILRWADPPVVELRLAAEGAQITPAAQPALDDFIDISPLGSTDRGMLREMAVTLTAPTILDAAARRSQTRKALAWMAQQFGFVDATEDRW